MIAVTINNGISHAIRITACLSRVLRLEARIGNKECPQVAPRLARPVRIAVFVKWRDGGLDSRMSPEAKFSIVRVVPENSDHRLARFGVIERISARAHTLGED